MIRARGKAAADVGLISDTHGLLRPVALEALRGSDLIIHAGDIGNGDVPSGTANISFYCDDIAQTVSELRARGVEFMHDVEDHGYGLVTFFKAPGNFNVQLYQPRYGK